MFNFSAVLILVLCNLFSFIEQGSTTSNPPNNSDHNPEGTSAITTPTSDTEIEEQSPIDQEKVKEIEGNYDAFILLRSLRSITGDKSDLRLPTRYSHYEKEKLYLIAGKSYFVETPLCPEIQTTDEHINTLMDNLDEVIPRTKGCLFIADDGQEKCESEPSATFQDITKKEGGIEEETICGTDNQQKLITTVFLNCGSKENMRDFAEKIKNIRVTDKIKIPEFKGINYPIYATCYDFNLQQTLWTKHIVRTPALLAHGKYPYKSLNTVDIKDFSTSTHNTKLKPKTLEKLKAAYESTELNKTMIQRLVPKEHMALPYWKKSTNHMINTAPLLPKFEPLMRAINEGIFKASGYALAKYGRKLKIYTKATNTTTSTSKTLQFFTRVGVVKAPPLITPNTWYKFIHDKKDGSGILIILHNTEQLVEKKECTDHEMRCNFQIWIDDETLIPKETLTHAYCCHVSQERIKELFSMKKLLLFQKKLQLQEMIDSYPTVIEKVPHIGDIRDFQRAHLHSLSIIYENEE